MKTVARILVVAMTAGTPGFAASVDYLREVKPVLAEHCYKCHGAAQQKSGLRLDTAEQARKGGEHGATFAPGQGAGSLLLKVVTGAHEEIPRMPYKKPPLSDAQVTLLRRWIDEGAPAPADERPEISVHWAFVPPQRVLPPTVKRQDWARNPIDRFILARLEQEGLAPSPEADRVTLIRRLSLDLLGLPPLPEEVDAFVNDRHPDAYERVVERLLASPHYGERWGRWWLDAARYADSNGYSIDAPRSIWKYRDWVINALNRDLPYDEFVIEQIAGDLIPNATLDQQIATGFHRNTQINQEGGIDPEQFRVESVMDRVNTTATTFLGITLACAQCHDHKFDPFTQREYYQFYAFFNSTIEDGHGKSAPEGMLEIPGETEAAENLPKELEEAEADLDRFLDTQGSEVVKWEQTLTPDEKASLQPDVNKALMLPFAGRTKKQKRIVYAAFRPDDENFKQRHVKLTRLEKNQPKPVTTLVMVERKEPRESTVFIKGDFTRPGAKVTPGVPTILRPLPQSGSAEIESAHWSSDQERSQLTSAATVADPLDRESSRPYLGSLRKGEEPSEGERTDKSPVTPLSRLDLAHWLVDTNNPLTARVIVNRIWQQYFGRGLVETENDFGTQGRPPSHPELLDWLACELMNPDGTNPSRIQHPETRIPQPGPAWSLKRLHRLTVNSAAYRQSSVARRDLATSDPNNRLLARQSRLRLDAEIVRDVCLSAGGLLNNRIGGPSVFPPQPDGVMNLGQSRREWKSSAAPNRYRRGLYTFFWRATPYPALMVFDAADGFSTCTRRVRSNTPLQALTLLNDAAFHEFAQALAARVLKDSGTTDAVRMEQAFRLCLSRRPAPDERQRLLELLNKELASFENRPEDAAALLNGETRGNADISQLAAWTAVSRVLLNLDEMITRGE